MGLSRGEHAHLPPAQGACRGFRADPEVRQALAEAAVPELSVPTLAEGETYKDLLADDSAFEGFDVEGKGARSHGASRIDQLAVEHLLGAR